jgi:ribosome-binding protein aMBF1 (putative translation factor)
MISSKQIKAARMLLGWKGKDLADKSGVGITTLRRYEAQDGIPNANKFVIRAIKICLEEAGVIFSGDPLTDPGVRLRKSD